MDATWSDNDSESSDDDNDIALTSVLYDLPMFVQEKEQLVCLNVSGSIKLDHTVECVDTAGTDSDESELDEDSLQESYKKCMVSG